MKKITKIILPLLFFFSLSCQNNSLNGKVLTGIEEDLYFDSGNLHFQTDMTFKNDSVIVERHLISVSENEKSGFKRTGELYRYKGAVKQNGNKLSFVATEYQCTDCYPIAEVTENGDIKDVLDKKIYEGQITENGVKLNGIEFKEN